MERKLKYMAPAILEELKIEMEGSILAQSVINNEEIEVESVGQEIYDVDELDSSWKQRWE